MFNVEIYLIYGSHWPDSFWHLSLPSNGQHLCNGRCPEDKRDDCQTIKYFGTLQTVCKVKLFCVSLYSMHIGLVGLGLALGLVLR